MNAEVLTQLDERVLVVTINRPAKKNAITAHMYSALATALADADRRDDVQAVLLRGACGNFTSGNDISMFVDEEGVRYHESPVYDFLLAMTALRKPAVACIRGHAVGIGATVLLHCDYVVASDDARIRFPFVDLGLCPEFASTLLLQQVVGRNKATEWLLLGAPIPAAEAHLAGLVNRVVPLELVEDEALSVAKRLAVKPRAALLATRGLIRESATDLVQASLQREGIVFDTLRKSREAQEIFDKFLQREPAPQRAAAE
ncbi:enoyl-CoA hydratase [Burkholderia sp. Ac-20384]|uniref:enoyl-CoA hydratase-related protein n=1 Tax=Burkholderia sp. Ac-20384 TaxID=2703902 RepID=UPI00197DAFD4|nr:enoyl-CoA hydratase-related protein [Burkholderia sp. Ac-20384]MBN3827509.1 enoyl-CoA hydratase [Burkholderia sp. Ac-20384]